MVYLPDPVFKNILDFCGDKELINLRGKDDTRLEEVKPGRTIYGSKEYDDYWSHVTWLKNRFKRYYDEEDDYDYDIYSYSCNDPRDELDKKYEIYDKSDRTLLILKHYETQDGKRYSKYCRDYNNPYACIDCCCNKGNKIYPRCYNCNLAYRKKNKTGFPKGKCLIKL